MIVSPIVLLVALTVFCAAIPAFVYLRNLTCYRKPLGREENDASLSSPSVSLLIPARNEAARIGPTLDAALKSQGVNLEVIVLDDHSTDDTADQVRKRIERDPRVRLEMASPLAPGWCGKQHACAALSRLATHDLLVFLDADVHLAPDALIRGVLSLEEHQTDLLSGVPRQVTCGFWEKLLLPLIHFVLLGFLPMWVARRCRDPKYAAGCGQFFLTTRSAYEVSGGHAAIRDSLHDGLKLPRAYRSAGLSTDLFDATELATCRMYETAEEVWSGLGKNAVEGLAAPRLIVPASMLLLMGSVMPTVLAIVWMLGGIATDLGVAVLSALFLSFLPRILAIRQFHQSVLSAVLHPVAVLLFLVIQWRALYRHLIRRPASWRGRSYGSGWRPVSS